MCPRATIPPIQILSVLTVALKLMPIVLIRTAKELCAKTKKTQNTAVTKVLPANDQRRPRAESTRYAPSYMGHEVSH